MSWLEELRKEQEQTRIIIDGFISKNKCTIEDIENLTEKQKAWIINSLIHTINKKK